MKLIRLIGGMNWNPLWNTTGSVRQQRVAEDLLKGVKIPLPPIPEQERIVAYLDSVREKVQALKETQSAKGELAPVALAMLHRPFKGQV